MTQPTNDERDGSRLTWILGLVLATAFVATIVWSVAQGADDDRPHLVSEDELDETTTTFVAVGEPILPPGPTTTFVVPQATLTVHTDGCGVIRSEVTPPVDDLGWLIKDADGFQVLNRNAEQEDRYRYFRPGTYTVVLEAHGEEISNTVTIRC